MGIDFFFSKNSIFDFFLQRAASAWSAEEFQVTLFDPPFPVDGWRITTEVLNPHKKNVLMVRFMVRPQSALVGAIIIIIIILLLLHSHCCSDNYIIIISSYVVIYIYDIKSKHFSIKQSDSIITIILFKSSSSYLIITSSHTHQPHHHIIVSLLCLHWYLHTSVFGCCSFKYLLFAGKLTLLW